MFECLVPESCADDLLGPPTRPSRFQPKLEAVPQSGADETEPDGDPSGKTRLDLVGDRNGRPRMIRKASTKEYDGEMAHEDSHVPRNIQHGPKPLSPADAAEAMRRSAGAGARPQYKPPSSDASWSLGAIRSEPEPAAVVDLRSQLDVGPADSQLSPLPLAKSNDQSQDADGIAERSSRKGAKLNLDTSAGGGDITALIGTDDAGAEGGESPVSVKSMREKFGGRTEVRRKTFTRLQPRKSLKSMGGMSGLDDSSMDASMLKVPGTNKDSDAKMRDRSSLEVSSMGVPSPRTSATATPLQAPGALGILMQPLPSPRPSARPSAKDASEPGNPSALSAPSASGARASGMRGSNEMPRSALRGSRGVSLASGPSSVRDSGTRGSAEVLARSSTGDAAAPIPSKRSVTFVPPSDSGLSAVDESGDHFPVDHFPVDSTDIINFGGESARVGINFNEQENSLKGPHYDPRVCRYFAEEGHWADGMCAAFQRPFDCISCLLPCLWCYRLQLSLVRAAPIQVGEGLCDSCTCVVTKGNACCCALAIFVLMAAGGLGGCCWGMALLAIGRKYQIKSAKEHPWCFLAKNCCCLCCMNVRVGLHVDRAQGFQKPPRLVGQMVEMSDQAAPRPNEMV